jgi:hypothetical protein
MIIKSLSVKTESGTRQLLQYLFKKESKLITNGNQKPLVIRKNIRARSLEKWVSEFKTNEALRIHKRKDSVKAYHTIISFSNKDRDQISEKALKAIAKQYMKQRGNDNLYIGTVHYDRDHVHLHMVSGGTKYLSGEASRLSRAEFAELKISMDKYQQKQFPELINSLPKHGKSKATLEPIIDKCNGRTTIKESLVKSLQSTYQKAKSLDAFLINLKAQGYEPYYRSDRLTGVTSEHGLKFRFSRLGLNQEKLELLNNSRTKEVEALTELRNLRERYIISKDIDEEKSSRSFNRDEENEQEEDIRNLAVDKLEEDDNKQDEEEAADNNSEDPYA